MSKWDFFGTFLETVMGRKNVGTINIAGRSFQGNNINMVGGRIIIDGVDVTDQAEVPEKYLEIRITEGSVENIQTDKSVSVMKGDVTGNINAGGSVNCNDVGGSVKANGSVNADKVNGSVDAGGSVNCDDVGGDVRAGGSVRADTIHGSKL